MDRKRRNVLRILATGGAAGVAWKLGLFGLADAHGATRSRALMGTTVDLTVLGPDRDEAVAAAEATLERMAGLEALLTRYRDDSEVGRLNASGRVDGASDALLDVLRLARHVSELSDGAFDVTVQPLLDSYRDHGGRPAGRTLERAVDRVDYRRVRLDGRTVTLGGESTAVTLDGVAKGYIVDRAVDTLRGHGFSDVFVDAGGDLVAAGDKGGDGPWRIGIRHPRGLSLIARFDARDRAVATSGDYMQHFTADYSSHHLLDPRTGRSAPELASSTIVAPNAAIADALATVTMVLGARSGRDLLEALPDCEGYLVAKDLTVTTTTGFRVA